MKLKRAQTFECSTVEQPRERKKYTCELAKFSCSYSIIMEFL